MNDDNPLSNLYLLSFRMTIFHVNLYSLRQAITQNTERINELRSFYSYYNYRSIKDKEAEGNLLKYDGISCVLGLVY